MSKLKLFLVSSISLLCTIGVGNIASESISCLADKGSDLENNRSIIYSASEFDNYLESYYHCLTLNFPTFDIGSCGYIALGMLLSYYDTFLNDNIIPENYDVYSDGNYGVTDMGYRNSSPGFCRELDFPSNFSNQHNFINEHSNSYLHCKLISIGNSLGYCNFSDEEDCYATNCSERVNILGNYLSNVVNLDSSSFSISSIEASNVSQSNSVRNYAINKVRSGHPVLLGVRQSQYDEYGHAVIAYYYDEDADELFCHFGGHDTTRVTPEINGYYFYKSAMTVDFNLLYNRPLNYLLFKNRFTGFCSYDCCLITTYNGSGRHYYDNRFEQYNNSFHKAYCVCGDMQYKPHRFLQSQTFRKDRSFYAVCVECGATVNLG